MIKFIKKLIEIVKNYDTILESQNEYTRNRFKNVNDRVDALTEDFRKLHSINVDVGYHEPSVVITIGRYRGRDHVEVKYITHDSLDRLIDQMKAMERVGFINRIDADTNTRKMIQQQINVDNISKGSNWL